MKVVELLLSMLAPGRVYCPKRTSPSPANLRAARRILEHRLRNWPGEVAIPQSQARFLPPFRKGGGQREVGT